jgi:DNA-binding transcriptional regulator YiaG
MVVIERWTGRHARALQVALRMTNEAFAEHLGVAVRTVAKWRERPEMVPTLHLQDVLDTALDRSSDPAKSRFVAILDTTP